MPARASPSQRHLFQRHWNVPVMAALWQRSGARFVELKSALGISADSLAATVRGLIHDGWVDKHGGYGHPLRPEYVLTPAGLGVGADCQAFVEAAQRTRAHRIAYRRWTAPVLVTLDFGARRFGEIRSALPGVSPRALTLGLRGMCEASLVHREVDAGYPPRAEYALTDAGATVAAVARPLLGAGVSGWSFEPGGDNSGPLEVR